MIDVDYISIIIIIIIYRIFPFEFTHTLNFINVSKYVLITFKKMYIRMSSTKNKNGSFYSKITSLRLYLILIHKKKHTKKNAKVSINVPKSSYYDRILSINIGRDVLK